MPPIDPRILLSGRPFQMPNRAAIEEEALSLAQLTDQRMLQRMQLQEAQRAQQERAALEQVLPDLVAGEFRPEAVQRAVRAAPAAGPGVLKYVEAQRKAQAEFEEKAAQTRKEDIEGKVKAFEWIGNAMAREAASPNPHSVSKALGMGRIFGIELPPPPQDPQQVQGWLQSIADSALQQKDRLTIAETGRANLAREAGQEAQRKETERYHTGTLGHQAATLAETRRGHNLTDARARELAGATREAAAAQREQVQAERGTQRTEAQAEKIGKAVDKDNLTSLVTSVKMVNDTLGKYADKDVPGVGATGMVPQFMLSDEGKTVRSRIRGVANDLLKLYSGGAVTLNEEQRRAAEMMASGGFSDTDLYNAWPLVVERVNSAVGNIKASFPPEAVELYQSRGGMQLEPMTPAKRGAATGGEVERLPDPSTLPDGTVVTNTKTGKRMVVRGGKYQ